MRLVVEGRERVPTYIRVHLPATSGGRPTRRCRAALLRRASRVGVDRELVLVERTFFAPDLGEYLQLGPADRRASP